MRMISHTADQARDYLRSIRQQIAEMETWDDSELVHVARDLQGIEDGLPSDRDAVREEMAEI